MSPAEVVKRARMLLAQGWSGGAVTLDHRGWICSPHSEEATRFAMHDAVEVAAAGDVDAIIEAEALLSLLAEPNTGRTLYEWELRPGRTQQEVVALFDRAVVRARFINRRENA